MNTKIAPFVDSGKKIKMRSDKIIAAAILSEFSGTLTIYFPDDTDEKIVFGEKELSATVTPQKISDYIEDSMFEFTSETLSDTNEKKKWEPFEFLYRIVENIERKKMIKFASSFIADYLTIKPEAGNFDFISKEVQAFSGRNKVQILPYFQKHYRLIYFLLLSRYAAIIPSPPEEKKIILERAHNILMEAEGYERKSTKSDADKERSKEEAVINYLSVKEKFKDVFHLLEISRDSDEKELQKAYLKIVQKIHPDRLYDVSEATKEKAEKLFRSVSEAYEMLKDPEEKKEIIRLMNKYQPIKSRSDFTRLKEYDEAIFKGTALERLGQMDAAKTVYDEIFKQTQAPDALERKILAHWKMNRKWTNEDEKSKNFNEIKEDIEKLKIMKDPALDVLYILIDINEYFGNIQDCMKILNMILRFYPEDHRATATKNKIAYYHSLKTKKRNK